MLALDDILLHIRPNLLTREFSALDIDNNSIIAAVLIIIHCKYEIPHLLLTKRSTYLSSHTGQISFPGGRFSPTQDKTLSDTAIRETKEEVGLDFKIDDILGRLQLVDTLTSNFTIVPFVILKKDIAEPIIISPYEVESIIDVPLEDTLATIAPDIDHYAMSEEGVYKFTYQNNNIWGATARILKQLHDCLLIKNKK